MFRASTAHSGRNSVEFRRPVRGSECASQRIQKRFRKRLRIRLQIRLQSRERSGAKRRGSERSRRSAHGPPWPQLSTAFPSAYQPARRCSALQPLTLAGILPNSGAPFAALNARPNAFRNDFGNAFGYAFRYAFRAASGAGRRPARASGLGVLRTARRCQNCSRRFAAHISPQGDAVRFNRSLWPSFWRTTAAVRGSESAFQRIEKRFRNRLQSRERSGAKRRRNERSRRCSHGSPWPQLCAAFRNACQRGRRGCAQQPLTLAVVLANDGRRSRL